MHPNAKDAFPFEVIMKEEFVPVVWPEDPTPSGVAGCTKCELHCQRNRVVWGEGNPEAPVLVMLDNPGAREDKEGRPYVCGTRQTLQQAAFETGFRMEDLYVTYVLKCRPVRKYDKEESRGICMLHMEQQIRKQQPQLAFCLGNTAVQWFFGDRSAEVKNMRGIWHQTRGIPTIVSYHPLAVRRRPNLYRQFLSDWNLLADRFFQSRDPR